MTINRLATPLDSFPSGLVISGEYLYVANSGTQNDRVTSISKIRLNPFQMVNAEWVSGLNGCIFLATDNKYLYVSNGSDEGYISRVLLSDPSKIDIEWAGGSSGSNSLVVYGNYLYTIDSNYDIIQIRLDTGGDGTVWKSDSSIMPYMLTTDNKYLYMSTFNSRRKTNMFIGRIELADSSKYEPNWFKLTSTFKDKTIIPNCAIVYGDYIYITLTDISGKIFTGLTNIGRINKTNIHDFNLTWNRISVNTIGFGLALSKTQLYASDAVNCIIERFELEMMTIPLDNTIPLDIITPSEDSTGWIILAPRWDNINSRMNNISLRVANVEVEKNVEVEENVEDTIIIPEPLIIPDTIIVPEPIFVPEPLIILEPVVNIPKEDICFMTMNSLVKTDQGVLPLNKVTSNNTIDGTHIKSVTNYITRDEYLVYISKNAFGEHSPIEDTLLLMNSKIMYDGVLVSAYKFIDLYEKINKLKNNGIIFHRINYML